MRNSCSDFFFLGIAFVYERTMRSRKYCSAYEIKAVLSVYDKKSCHYVLTNIVVNDMMIMTRKVVKVIRGKHDRKEMVLCLY